MASFTSASSSSWIKWFRENYAAPLESVQQLLRGSYIVLVFLLALFIGALKAVVVGPIAGLLLIVGNIGVILGLFSAHVAWTVYSLIKTKLINAALKFLFLLALPVFFGLWLVLSIFGSVLVGVGYGFFTPWVSTFEAFRKDTDKEKFLHSIKDGTWGTIRGSCTVVRDFADLCYHSYPLYLKELRESTSDQSHYSIRITEVPSCIVVGLMGLIVDVPLYTAIAVIKSPYMLFKGWQRLLHDLISGEGPFLETACVPIAGLAILLWPLFVIGSILIAIISSIFVGLYGAVVVYQERSFKRGVAYVIATVAEFDEYTNDWLYLREGTILPKPRYRKKKPSNSSELSVGANSVKGKGNSGPFDAPGMLVPSLAPSRSVREAIQEVKMVQIWEEIMMCPEMRGKELVDANILTSANLSEWLKTKGNSQEIVGLGLSSYALLHSLVFSINSGSTGLLLSNGVELTHQNRPQDRLMDWFFHPVMVLKEQIRVIKMNDDEMRFLEKLVIFTGNIPPSVHDLENGSLVPQDALRAAQIQAISRRLVGMTRSISKFPTYRRRYRQVVKVLLCYSLGRECPQGMSVSHSNRSNRSNRSGSSVEIVPADV